MFSEILEELDIPENPESSNKPSEKRTVTFDPIVQEYSANHKIIWNRRINGTVSVISSDPSCKHGKARFTTIPLKALSE